MSTAPGAQKQAYVISGYAYTGGGRKITRCEVSLDGGLTWRLADMERPEQPTEYGKYWCWVFYSLSIDAALLSTASEVCCRAWDAGNNTQPAHITWNVMGMGNNAVFRVRVRRTELGPDSALLAFEHPTLPGAQRGGWMGDTAGGWVPDYAAPGAGPAAALPPAPVAEVAPTPAVAAPAQVPVPLAGGGRLIAMEEVKMHNTAADCWVVVAGKVYDTTAFNEQHPGGGSSITINAGTDCSEEFEAIHSKRAWKMLDEWYIGDLAAAGTVLPPAPPPTPPSAAPAAALPAAGVLDPRKRLPFPVVARTEVSRNARILRLGLPTPQSKLGLPVGQHVMVCAKVEGKLVMRAYTPISSDRDCGYVDLLVKVYFPNEDPAHPAGRSPLKRPLRAVAPSLQRAAQR